LPAVFGPFSWNFLIFGSSQIGRSGFFGPQSGISDRGFAVFTPIVGSGGSSKFSAQTLTGEIIWQNKTDNP